VRTKLKPLILSVLMASILSACQFHEQSKPGDTLIPIKKAMIPTPINSTPAIAV